MVHNVPPSASPALLFCGVVKLMSLRSYGTALQQPSLVPNEQVQTLGDLEDVLPDIPVWWTGESHFEPKPILG